MARSRPRGAAIIDVFDAGLLAQFRDAQPCGHSLVLAQGGLAIEQKTQPFRMAEPVGLIGRRDFDKGLGHAVQAEGVELVEGWMFEQKLLS